MKDEKKLKEILLKGKQEINKRPNFSPLSLSPPKKRVGKEILSTERQE